jgi:hypothetical protein
MKGCIVLGSFSEHRPLGTFLNTRPLMVNADNDSFLSTHHLGIYGREVVTQANLWDPAGHTGADLLKGAAAEGRLCAEFR